MVNTQFFWKFWKNMHDWGYFCRRWDPYEQVCDISSRKRGNTCRKTLFAEPRTSLPPKTQRYNNTSMLDSFRQQNGVEDIFTRLTSLDGSDLLFHHLMFF